MYPENIVIFKGKKDGIVVILDEAADFEQLKGALSIKVVDAQKFFGGAKMSISFQGRQLSSMEESELLDIIINKANLNVSFVREPENALSKELYEAKESRARRRIQNPFEQAEEMLKGAFNPMEHMATIHKGSLRSGRSIKFPGSVIVLGDINPGAEIIAEGNVVVLGTIKGVVHAGCRGNTECFVAALCLSPVQLRIADRATYIPEEIMKKNKKKPMPSYAYIQEGKIYIVPLM